MAKGDSVFVVVHWNAWRATVNTGEPWPDADMAWLWVLRIQTKLHQWAIDALIVGSTTVEPGL